MAEAAVGRSPGNDTRVTSLTRLEVRVVATMSSEDDPVGAWKQFEKADGGRTSRAVSLGTRQMYKRREKKQVMRRLGESWHARKPDRRWLGESMERAPAERPGRSTLRPND